MKESLLDGEMSKELDLSYLHLSPGVYLLVIKGMQGNITKIFIVHSRHSE